MRTIVEPQKHIVRIWGTQQVTEGIIFRLMKYVLRVDTDGKVLLHNVITGQMVILDEREVELLDKLPAVYSQEMESLVVAHYLVPVDYCEREYVKKLQLILRKLEGNQAKPVKWYTILPTTACNARCYYCFEHGVKTVTMTEEIAEKVVEFIDSHCGADRSVYITWFGGEPTVAANRINQICEGLKLRGIEYKSSISTNGYLLDENMAQKAKKLWNLQFAQICLDGTEESYNKIKNFVNAEESPYQKVLRNVGSLLDLEIRVGLRMNFDLGNYSEFKGVIDDAVTRFGHNKYLHVNAYPVIGNHVNRDGKIIHGTDSWLIDTYTELNDLAKKCEVATERYDLPYLSHIGCDADNPMAVTITPDGALVRCCERFEEDEWTGNVIDGVTNPELVKAWTEVTSYDKCEECVMYPRCLRLKRCVAQDRCYFMQEKERKSMEAMRQAYAKWIIN